MNAPAQNLLSQMDDIKGLDHISWWPLAPGWWVIIAILLLAMAAATIFARRRRAWRQSWKGDAERALDALERDLDAATARDVLARLSVILRRIAMQRYSRAACAGLEGRDWLAWLKKHDPRGFDWIDAGALLTEAPYAPPGMMPPPEKIKPLIAAARQWVA